MYGSMHRASDNHGHLRLAAEKKTVFPLRGTLHVPVHEWLTVRYTQQGQQHCMPHGVGVVLSGEMSCPLVEAPSL